MQPATRLFLLALLLCAPAARAKAPDKPAAPPTLSSEPPIQLGVFDGSGRACAGQLTITPNRLTWKTPFSPCAASAYTLVERRQTERRVHWVYRLKTPSKRCLYKTVSLEKMIQEDGWVGWNASGFWEKPYRTNTYGELNCYLVKLD